MLATVAPGRTEELLAELERLPLGNESPFAKLGGTHFARFVVVPYLRDRHGDQRSAISYLIFASEFDGRLDSYVDALCAEMEPTVRAIFRHCLDCPQEGGPEALREYLLRHHVAPGYSVLAYEGVTVEEVQASLELSERLVAFSIAAGDHEPADLKRAWQEAFPEVAG